MGATEGGLGWGGPSVEESIGRGEKKQDDRDTGVRWEEVDV